MTQTVNLAKNSDGIIDYEASEQVVTLKPIKSIFSFFDAKIGDVDPVWKTLVKSNFKTEVDVENKRVTLSTLPLAEQDLDVRYNLAAPVEYTYDVPTAASLIESLNLGENIKVYLKDAWFIKYILGQYLPKVSRVGDDDDKYKSIFESEYWDNHNDYAVTPEEAPGQYRFTFDRSRQLKVDGKVNQQNPVVMLCSDYTTYEFIVEVVANPPAAPTDITLSGGAIHSTPNDLINAR